MGRLDCILIDLLLNPSIIICLNRLTDITEHYCGDNSILWLLPYKITFEDASFIFHI